MPTDLPSLNKLLGRVFGKQFPFIGQKWSTKIAETFHFANVIPTAFDQVAGEGFEPPASRL